MTTFLTTEEVADLKELVLCPSEDEAIPAKESAKTGSGIYMLFARNGRLLYIGKSINLSERIYQHWLGMRYKHSQKRFSYFVTMDVSIELISAIEIAHIHALRPPLNLLYETPSWEHHDALVGHILRAWS